MDVSVLLVWEGALVLGVLALRAASLRLVDPEDLPARLRRRVRLGTRLTPALLVLALIMIAIGVVARFAG